MGPNQACKFLYNKGNHRDTHTHTQMKRQPMEFKKIFEMM